MKKCIVLLLAGMLVFGCTGCGGQKAEIVTPSENEDVGGTQADTVQSGSEAQNSNNDDPEEKGNHSEIAAFAEKIQSAVESKDMEALADLCSYPLAVNGEVVEDKDAFVGLGEDVIFTEERCAVIASVDISALEETMAGVVMGDATPNIIFKSEDGNLGITGIN